MGVGSGGQGGTVALLDFHTWYIYIADRGLIADRHLIELLFGLFSLFFDLFFAIFGLFSVAPLPRKRLNSGFFFGLFLLFFGLFSVAPLLLEIFLPTPLIIGP